MKELTYEKVLAEYKKNYTERYLSIISENKKFLNEFK